ncbi:MAG: dihydrolipoamide acetyltransferase family protein [Betaproteobacteria bacterium]
MIVFRLPSLGADMDKGTLLEWRVGPGDPVKKGDVVAVVDTTKAAIDVECWHDGTVEALLVEPGSEIPVGTAMAVLREAGETSGQLKAQVEALRATPKPVAAPAAAAAAPTVAAAGEPERHAVSPAARRRAAELHVALERLAGTGPGGAVTLADVEKAAAAPAPSRAEAMRETIAAAMARSKREIPHYYLADDVLLEAAMAWLAARNRERSVTERLLLAPLLLQAVARALQRYPEFNGFWKDGRFTAVAEVQVGVAIALRGGGLVAPALRDVVRKDVDTVNRELLDLVARTRAGTLRASELSDPTITVTSLGDQGVRTVFPIIYPPQVAIVGFGRVTDRPWTVDGGVRPLPVTTASLGADHRVSDGHRGALFLAAIGDHLQRPGELAKGPP